MVFARFPASILGRTNDGILVPARMAAAAMHFLAFIIVTQDRLRLVPYALPTPYTAAEFDAVLNELNTALAFTFLCYLFSCAAFLSGLLIRHETLHFVQTAFHVGGAALLFCVWDYSLHVNRVWHSLLFFNLLPVAIDALALIDLWRRQMFWL